MSPQKIAAQAARQNIEVIAICDHNSAENVRAVMKAAESKNVVVLPGIEVCTSEETHVLAIFDNLNSVLDMQSLVFSHLAGTNDPEAFGLQIVANEFDEVIEFQNRMLIGAIDLPVERVVDEIHRRGGAAIASHIDRESFSVISQLGFIPDSLRFEALELSSHIRNDDARSQFTSYSNTPFIRNSDAHFLEDIGTNTSEYMLEKPTFQEILMALRSEDGRTVCES